MEKMVYGIATREWDGWLDCVASWDEHTAPRTYPFAIVKNMNVLEAYQTAFEKTREPILAFLHDDLRILEQDWDLRVLKEFEDPQVGMVGFAGAIGHGRPELYKEPFKVPNLVRMDFLSNLQNAEAHGRRFTGERDVAVLDGLAIFVRRSILEKWGGWPVDKPVGYWMYSENLCCEARRQGYRIRLVGVDCDHLGGKTAAIANVTDDYEACHRYFWENNRDVMPFRVEGA
jgi:GT2 family glycosyltransferase